MNRSGTRALRHIPLAIVGLTILAALPVAAAHSQTPWPALQFGRISQGSPLTSESGWTSGIRVPVTLHRGITVRPGVDFVRSHVNSSIAVCTHIPGSDDCLRRPDSESVIYGMLGFRAVLLPAAQVSPYVEGGGAVGRSLNEANPGERRTFAAPHVGLGVHIPTRLGTWSIGGWWRRLDRWPEGLDTSSITALVVGFHLGHKR